MTFLDKILAEKRREVAELKAAYQPQNPVRTPLSLFERFIHADHVSIISEIKRASPSKGLINDTMIPSEQAAAYEQSGAGAISVLTDTAFFQGTMDDLKAVRAAVDLPILNKDFIIDEIQIDRAFDAGADVILLIAAALEKERLQELYRYAKAKGLDILLEVHNEAELQVAQEIDAKVIGINNRDLKTFEVDLAVTERLTAQINTAQTLVISESGITNRADVERVKQAGAKGILVGESLMRAKDLPAVFTDLKVALEKEQQS